MQCDCHTRDQLRELAESKHGGVASPLYVAPVRHVAVDLLGWLRSCLRRPTTRGARRTPGAISTAETRCWRDIQGLAMPSEPRCSRQTRTNVGVKVCRTRLYSPANSAKCVSNLQRPLPLLITIPSGTDFAWGVRSRTIKLNPGGLNHVIQGNALRCIGSHVCRQR